MMLMAVLALSILIGCIAIWLWGGLGVQQPWKGAEGASSPTVKELVRRYLWYATVVVAAGMTSGLIMAGAGGRLAMRILAATSSESAQGRITEADEIVGRITIDGSIGFILFIGVSVGLLSGVSYMLVRRWLPVGRWGGFTFGAMLLILLSTRVEPLRPDNEDFDIVGPGWLSVVVFMSIGLGHGMLLAALAGRFSRTLPLISKQRATLAKHAPILFLFVVPPVIGIAVLIGGLYILSVRFFEKAGSVRVPVVTKIGRAIGAAALLVALPGFISGVTDIIGRP